MKVSVEVTNTGTKKGDEVVQLYIRDLIASVTRPVKELKGFQRISLEPGEKKTVTLELKPEDFAFYNRDMKFEIEPGFFDVMVGSSSDDYKTVKLEVIE